jgi:hypothetical protein
MTNDSLFTKIRRAEAQIEQLHEELESLADLCTHPAEMVETDMMTVGDDEPLAQKERIKYFSCELCHHVWSERVEV